VKKTKWKRNEPVKAKKKWKEPVKAKQKWKNPARRRGRSNRLFVSDHTKIQNTFKILLAKCCRKLVDDYGKELIVMIMEGSGENLEVVIKLKPGMVLLSNHTS